MTNCLLYNNSAPEGSAMYLKGESSVTGDSATRIYDNNPPQNSCQAGQYITSIIAGIGTTTCASCPAGRTSTGSGYFGCQNANGAGTCSDSSTRNFEVSDADGLKGAVACAAITTEQTHTILVKQDVQLVGVWSRDSAIVVDFGSKIVIKGDKIGGGKAQIKGQGNVGGAYRIFFINRETQVTLENLELRGGYRLGSVSFSAST